MRRPFGAFTAVACLSVALVPVPASAATATDLWVDNRTTSCSDAGVGTLAQPFCTLAAATTVVTAGQTVHVRGSYDERLSITRSGTPEQPITFMVDPGNVTTLAGTNAGITIQGQHDVAVVGFLLHAQGAPVPVTVTQSTRIRLERIDQPNLLATNPAGIQFTGVTDSTIIGSNLAGQALAGVSLDADTTGVTVRGGNVQVDGTDSRGIDVYGPDNVLLDNLIGHARGAGVRINPGAHRTVIANNWLHPGQGHGVHNTDADDTALSNNNVNNRCGTGIRIDGTSTGVSIQNNETMENGEPTTSCAAPVGQVNIGVYDGAVGHTTVDYNNVYGLAPERLYAWQTPMGLAEFRAASGQAAHDQLTNLAWMSTDSANSAAPGWQATDFYGRRRTDDPRSPNKGVGPISYGDRGIYEEFAFPTAEAKSTIRWSRMGPVVSVDASASTAWQPFTLTYTIDFGDGTVVSQADPFASHVYRGGTPHTVTVYVTDSNGMSSLSPAVIITNPAQIRAPRRPYGTITLPTRYRNVW